MECAAAKPFKPPSHISDIVSRVAKVCKFRSIGVFSTDNPCNQHRKLFKAEHSFNEEISSDATEEAECVVEKVHPQPAEMEKGKDNGDMEILKLFDTLSSLKLAYVQLQEAHIPYDPDKIRAADEVIVSQLESLCKIKRAYKERQLKDFNSISARSALLLAEIQVEERHLENLKLKVKDREARAMDLRQELRHLELKNKKLGEELKQSENESLKVWNISSFQDVAIASCKAIHDFAKPLIALMKVSGWDLDRAANLIEDSVAYSKRSHKKYAFEAYISRRMFHDFSPQVCNIDRLMSIDDPIDALIENPNSSFGRFCRTKYLLIVHPVMEMSFFGNMDHRIFLTNGLHPQTPFYRAFVKMARLVWILQGISNLVEPKAELFCANREAEFSDVYMDCVEELEADRMIGNDRQERLKVEFMVTPGFRTGDTVVRSRVYISTPGIREGAT